MPCIKALVHKRYKVDSFTDPKSQTTMIFKGSIKIQKIAPLIYKYLRTIPLVRFTKSLIINLSFRYTNTYLEQHRHFLSSDSRVSQKHLLHFNEKHTTNLAVVFFLTFFYCFTPY